MGSGRYRYMTPEEIDNQTMLNQARTIEHMVKVLEKVARFAGLPGYLRHEINELLWSVRKSDIM